MQVGAEALDASGNQITGKTFTWTTGDTTIATVDGSGNVLGKRLGNTTVTARADTASATGLIVVRPPMAARLVIQSTSYQMVEGDTLTLPTPTVLDASGNAETGRTVTYASTNPSVATVSSTGVVQAVLAGSTTISERVDTASVTVTITVTQAAVASVRSIPSAIYVAVGNQVHTQERAYSASGARLLGRSYTLTSSNPAVATVDGAGAIHGVAPGSATVTVTSGAGTETLPVSVAQLGGGTFHIDLRFIGNVSATVQQAALAAKARWENVVTTALVPYQIVPSDSVTSCGKGIPNINELVPNMIIYVSADSIDGPGNTAGEGGPCVIRDDAPQLAVVGSITIDTADVAWASSNGILVDLMTHEMGHILGIGTFWGLPGTSFANTATGLGGPNPVFTGFNARRASADLGFTSDSTQGVPIENTGGAGTRDAHWRASVFGHELMTGTLNLGSNPLSLVTIEALADFGYVVAPQAAADFSVLNANTPSSFPSYSASINIPLHDAILMPKFTVTKDGVLKPLRVLRQPGTIDKQ